MLRMSRHRGKRQGGGRAPVCCGGCGSRLARLGARRRNGAFVAPCRGCWWQHFERRTWRLFP